MSHTNRILVVDDNRDLGENLVEILEVHGFDADLYDDPVRAAEEFRGGRYCLALVDLQMPRLDGVDLLRALRATEPSLAALAMTAFARDDRVRSVLALGVLRVFAKPLDTDALVRAVRGCCSPT